MNTNSINMATKKRKCDITPTDSSEKEHDLPPIIQTWSRFLVMAMYTPEGTPNALAQLSPFVIHKTFQGLCGELKSLKKLANGTYLLQCFNNKQSILLRSTQTFAGIKVSITPHEKLNSSKGVIRSPDLRYVDEQEIVDSIPSVTAAKRITITKGNRKVPTNTFILDFSQPTTPSTLTFGYTKLNVDPYVPNPLRCFQCQKYGHHKSNCRGQACCSNCGKKDHEREHCTNDPHCVNCKGSHPATDKSCPDWIFEKKVQALRIEKNITSIEARKTLQPSQQPSVIVPGATSYAKAVSSQAPKPPPPPSLSKSTCSASTQTDSFCCPCALSLLEYIAAYLPPSAPPPPIPRLSSITPPPRNSSTHAYFSNQNSATLDVSQPTNVNTLIQTTKKDQDIPSGPQPDKSALNMIESYDTDEEIRPGQTILLQTPEIDFTNTNPFNALQLNEYSDISDEGSTQCEPMDSPETPCEPMDSPETPPPQSSQKSSPPQSPRKVNPPEGSKGQKKDKKSPQKAPKNGGSKKGK